MVDIELTHLTPGAIAGLFLAVGILVALVAAIATTYLDQIHDQEDHRP